MANRKEIGLGAQGSDVSYLQNMLKKNGYNLAVDGIYGSKTQAAVKDYQKKNGLAVDGIVGGNTWGKLDGPVYGSPLSNTLAGNQPTATVTKKTDQLSNTAYKPSTAVNNAQTQLNQASKNKPGAYQQSDAVAQAQAMLQQQLASKPGAYQSQWQAGLDQIMDKILNREKFSYDLNGDALYQQYKDQAILQGQQAMMDTMGHAQAMTGGYGNSYAQTAGQQTYQGYLQQLNDKVPELYQLALNQYNLEGEELYNQYGLMADRENQDYGRHRDQVADWGDAYDRAYQQFQNERNFDYGQHRDQVADWNNAYEQAYQKWQDERSFDYGQYADNRDYQYQVGRDTVSDQQWKDSFQYQKDRDAAADAKWQAEFDEAKRQYDQNYGLKTGGSSSSSNSNSSQNTNPSPAPASYDNGTVSTENVKKIQAALGVTADGKWGPASQAAAKKKWGVSSANEAWSKYQPAHTPQTAVDPTKFTGSTYSEAVAYMKTNGVPGAAASSAMTAQEWTRRKNAGSSSAEVKNYSSYKEYLADFVEYQMSKK